MVEVCTAALEDERVDQVTFILKILQINAEAASVFHPKEVVYIMQLLELILFKLSSLVLIC